MTGAALSRKTIDVDIIWEVLADLKLQVTRKEFESTQRRLREAKVPANGSHAPSQEDSSGELSLETPESGAIHRWIEEASCQASQPTKKRLDEKVKKEHHGASSSVAEETRKRLHKEVSAALEGIQDASARLGILEEEHLPGSMDRLPAQTTEQVQKQISDLQTALEKQADESAEPVKPKNLCLGKEGCRGS
jgi:hypothetical protein